MHDRFEIHSRRSSLKLPSDDEDRRRIRTLVEGRDPAETADGVSESGGPDTPFRRMVDFWFAAIAWAAFHELPLPDDDSQGREFVKVTSDGKGIRLEPWRVAIINALYLYGQDALHDDPVDLDKVDTSGGKVNEHGTPIGASTPITVANRYALAGAMPLYEALTTTQAGDAATSIRQLTAAANFKKVYEASEKNFCSTFIDPVASRLP